MNLTVTIDPSTGAIGMDLPSLMRAALDFAENEGFELDGASNVSEAIYLTRPGSDSRLRIAAHGGQRDQVVSYCTFPTERALIEGEWRTIVALDPATAVNMIISAIKEYDACLQ